MGEFEELHHRDSAGPQQSSKTVVSKAPLPKKPPAPATEHTLRVNVARAALLNAQHWFDKGIASFDGKHPIDWRTIAANAFPSLQEAQAVAGQLEGVGSQLTERLDETRRAMDTYIERVAARVAADEAKTFLGVVDKLRGPDSVLRFAHDLPLHPARGAHIPANKHDDVYEAQALGATLDLIALEASTALTRVRDSKDAKTYRPVVLATTAALQKDLTYAGTLLDAYSGKEKDRAFTAKLQVASVALAGLQRFIKGRQNNKVMRDEFAVVEATANKLRAAAHLDPLENSVVGVSNVQHDSETQEKAGFDGAMIELDAALGNLQGNIELGATRFYELAKLEDPPEPGSMWPELAEGLIVALLGNIVGARIGRVMKGLSLDGAEDVAGGAASDTLQAWAGVFTTARTNAQGDKNERIRDALFFRESLLAGRYAVTAGVKEALATRLKHSSVSSGEVHAIATEAQQQAVTAKDRTYQSTARDFALFLARRGLGGTVKRHGKDVSKIGTSHEYFFGNDLKRMGQRDGTDGIAKLAIELDRDGHTIQRFQVQGMNQDMANAILDGSSRRISKLGVPTEIEISPRWSRSTFTLVLDETGELRTWSSWEHLRATEPIIDKYSTPQKAWQQLHGEIIPTTVKVS